MKRGPRLVMAGLVAATLLGAVPQAVASPQFTGTKVAAKDNFFVPSKVTITVGTKVKWVNKGISSHTTTSDDALWGKKLAPGQTFVYTFNSTGTFLYHCKFHFGMTGKVVVTSG